MVMKRETARKLLYDIADGGIFTATFIKKNGERRTMNCRKRVKKHLRGGVRAYDPKLHDLVFVFDMQKLDYRCINISTLETLKFRGEEYTIED